MGAHPLQQNLAATAQNEAARRFARLGGQETFNEIQYRFALTCYDCFQKTTQASHNQQDMIGRCQCARHMLVSIASVRRGAMASKGVQK